MPSSSSEITVSRLIEAMESIAPLSGAESWDKVGLHVGTRVDPVTGPVLLTIDLTEAVLDEAIGLKASAIIAYHPPIWDGLTRLTDATAAERIVRGAIAHGIAIYSPHTALDAANGGVCDWLCEGIAGLADGEEPGGRIAGDRRALTPQTELDSHREVKIVTFVPAEQVDQLRNAMATSGAGKIGAYRVCSFESAGHGTFLPGAGANPVVGEPGRLSRVEERRLEMVCSRSALALAIETLRQFHPYEEPAYDIYELLGEPQRTVGVGRKLVLDQPATLEEVGRRLRAFLDRARIKIALPHGQADEPLLRFGVVPGAGASLLDVAAAEGCQAFITGEMRHHDVVAAQARGIRVLLAGHTNTERGYLPRLAMRLSEELSGVRVEFSRADRDPLTLVTG